ncbi:hypothetical protein Baya_9900 [Bagarius yarrelli]|uniref:Uncharacterized protein n=1 Tax=Bagarius yarrelli TaxID=175774 RepID=A0A556U9V6_BAGYA|nr:hypothetical protein Baya_9900 [Bagarius yarrelli]
MHHFAQDCLPTSSRCKFKILVPCHRRIVASPDKSAFEKFSNYALSCFGTLWHSPQHWNACYSDNTRTLKHPGFFRHHHLLLIRLRQNLACALLIKTSPTDITMARQLRFHLRINQENVCISTTVSLQERLAVFLRLPDVSFMSQLHFGITLTLVTSMKARRRGGYKGGEAAEKRTPSSQAARESSSNFQLIINHHVFITVKLTIAELSPYKTWRLKALLRKSPLAKNSNHKQS